MGNQPSRKKISRETITNKIPNLQTNLNSPQKSTKKVLGSKVSKEWMDIIQTLYGIKIQYGNEDGTGEYTIKGPKNRAIYFDGYCESNNTVYEFHGCKYHNCRECFPTSSYDLYIKTLEREQFILSKGFSLFRIWEHEFRQYKKGNINICGQHIVIETIV